MGRQMFDQYSFLHFCTGSIGYFFGLGWKQWLLLHVGFELFENSAFGMSIISKISFWPGQKNYADSFVNSMIGDNISSMVGFFTAKLLDEYGMRKKWFSYK